MDNMPTPKKLGLPEIGSFLYRPGYHKTWDRVEVARLTATQIVCKTSIGNELRLRPGNASYVEVGSNSYGSWFLETPESIVGYRKHVALEKLKMLLVHASGWASNNSSDVEKIEAAIEALKALKPEETKA